MQVKGFAISNYYHFEKFFISQLAEVVKRGCYLITFF